MSGATAVRQRGERELALRINGEVRRATVDVRTTLLDLLRERLGLTGTKKGCDHGQCGACTVHVDGRAALACLTFAVALGDAEVTTIEGLADGEALQPVQAAFVACDELQCGYCTPGQIMSAAALLAEDRPLDDAALAEAMSGNLCRCGAYPKIREAIRRAAV